MSQYDAILIPGGGLTEQGELPIWTQRRLERAIQIGDFRFVITLSAGTTHKPPPLDEKGFPVLESIAAAKYLLQRGIPAQRILTETSSYDTIGNAFFSRVIHVDPLHLKKLLVITSEFHMPRTKAIFLWVYGLSRNHNEYQLAFESVPDNDIDDEIISARKERERESLIRLEELKARIKTFEEFHLWLFHEHKAYSIANSERLTLKGNVLKSY
jgi:hypothetical protein